MAKLILPKKHHYFHFDKRLRERYGINITKSEYFDLCEEIEQTGDKYLLESRRTNQNYFYVPFMGHNLIVVYNREKQLLITTYTNHHTPEQLIRLTVPPYLADTIYLQHTENLFFLKSSIQLNSGHLVNLQKQKTNSVSATMFVIRTKKVYLHEISIRDRENILTPVKGGFHSYLTQKEQAILNQDTPITQVAFALLGKIQEY